MSKHRKLPYAPVKRGNRFWQPTPEMRELGFRPTPLGPDGPQAMAKATHLYNEWVKARSQVRKITDYPAGSFGAYYDRFTGRLSGTPVNRWKTMAPRTREDYARAWPRLEPAFAKKIITAITTEDCEVFYADLEAKVSASERYRTVKVLKILLEDARTRLRLSQTSPAARLSNPQAPGRSAIWLGAEIDQLIRAAENLGYRGIAVSIRIGWETLFSPVDVWSIRKGSLKKDAAGLYVERTRTKTKKAAFGALSLATATALDDYLKALGLELTPDAFVIRTRSGAPYARHNKFAEDFRAVREKAFPGDKRQFLDIRRSGNVEADAGGAAKADMGEILANSLASNKFIEDTYTPPTVAKAREIAAQRLTGRLKLASEVIRLTRRN